MVKYKQKLDMRFDALGQPNRRRIIELLKDGTNYSLTDIAEHLDISLPAALKHVHILKEAKFIKTYKEGRILCIEQNKKAFDEMIDWLVGIQQFWNESFDRLEEHLKEDKK